MHLLSLWISPCPALQWQALWGYQPKKRNKLQRNNQTKSLFQRGFLFSPSCRAHRGNLVRSQEADVWPQMRLQRPFHSGASSWTQNRRGIDRAGLKCGIDHYGIYWELRESCCCGLVRPCLFSVAWRRWGNAGLHQLEWMSRKCRKQKSRSGPRCDCRGGKSRSPNTLLVYLSRFFSYLYLTWVFLFRVTFYFLCTLYFLFLTLEKTGWLLLCLKASAIVMYLLSYMFFKFSDLTFTFLSLNMKSNDISDSVTVGSR